MPDNQVGLSTWLRRIAGSLVWCCGLGYLDYQHIIWNGDVDATGFVVAAVALAPTWLFIGATLSMKFLGQDTSISVSPVAQAMQKLLSAGPKAVGASVARAALAAAQPDDTSAVALFVTSDGAMTSTLRELAIRHNVPNAESLDPLGIVKALQQSSLLSDEEAEGWTQFIRLGRQIKAGSPVDPDAKAALDDLIPALQNKLDEIAKR